MDDRRFDSLTKALAAGANRRSLFKGLLGLGGAAFGSGALVDSQVEAARRPAPKPKPVTCPGQQTWSGSQCVCPAGLSKCGPDCCNDDVASSDPSYSECCDNACCPYPNECLGEELCCPRLPNTACLNDRGWCCGTLCVETIDGPSCCAAANVCGSECCGDGQYCCTDVNGNSQCIPNNECCRDENCEYLDELQPCAEGYCLLSGSFSGTCGIRGRCKDDTPYCCASSSGNEPGICVSDNQCCPPGDITCGTCGACDNGSCVEASGFDCGSACAICESREGSGGSIYECVDCAPGMSCCGGNHPSDCVDVQTDPLNCGACFEVCSSLTPHCCDGGCWRCCENEHCPPQDACTSGVCLDNHTCETGYHRCQDPEACCGGPDCANLDIDKNNCGECGNVCDSNEICDQGNCVPPQ